MGENEDKEIERRVGQELIFNRLEVIDSKVEKMAEGFEIFKTEWIKYQIACAKDNVVERVKTLEERPQKSVKGWETRLGIVLMIVSIIVASITIYSATSTERKQHTEEQP